jgi:hypothetical protein
MEKVGGEMENISVECVWGQELAIKLSSKL